MQIGAISAGGLGQTQAPQPPPPQGLASIAFGAGVIDGPSTFGPAQLACHPESRAVPELAPGGPQPDVLNYAWRDYGNRVGAWRMLELFDALGWPCSVLLNSAIYDYAPQLAAAFRARGDEFVGHGRSNAERQGILDEAGERALIAEATAAIARHEGRAPAGWLGPWISQSRVTPDLLQEAGYSLVHG